MGLLKIMPFKVAVPKPKRNKTSDGIKRTTNKIVKGKVFQDKNGTYKVSAIFPGDNKYKQSIEYDEFTIKYFKPLNVTTNNTTYYKYNYTTQPKYQTRYVVRYVYV